MKKQLLQILSITLLTLAGFGNAPVVLVQDNYWGADGFSSHGTLKIGAPRP